jgi:deoxyribodipyrimidine photo-lyase
MPDASGVPSCRLRRLNEHGLRAGGAFVLYWMTGARRSRWNFALDRALELARQLDRPLVVLEALRCDYRWASDRIHAFVLQGMQANSEAFAGTGVFYYPYVEREPRAGRGLLRALGESACAVVTDDVPGAFFEELRAAAAGQVSVALEAVDSNGLLPVRATERVFARAYDFRRFLQRNLAPFLEEPPQEDGLAGMRLRPLAALPAEIVERWPAADPELLCAQSSVLARLPLDHSVRPVESCGGSAEARRVLHVFTEERLERYAELRNQPMEPGASDLSPYLHFGHISPHEILAAVAAREGWTPASLQSLRSGARLGWWGMSEEAESFLDQLVTWRELGLNFAAHRDDIERYSSLPDWARNTLEAHAGDTRPHAYTRRQFESAETHDPVWNAAQTELLESGRMHNYLRMLWGKKILHWSVTPEAALETMLELNNRHALDGRDSNSCSGIFWVLGRYDRAWGPEREVFGKIRYMSSKNTQRKLRMRKYLERWGTPAVGQERLYPA